MLCSPFNSSTSLEDFVEVADVITNYSLAEIPLETMWTDIGKAIHVMDILTTNNLSPCRLHV